MKITNSKKRLINKNTLVISGAIVALLIISALAYVYKFDGNLFGWSSNTDSNESINYDEPTQQQKDDGLSAKESFVNKYYSDSEKDTPSESDPAKKTDVGVVISSTSQTSDAVQIRTILQTLNQGTCKLTMTKEGLSSITRTVETQNLGSYSTCKGFDIPLTDLEQGTWNIVVDFSNDNESGNANQKIEVQ